MDKETADRNSEEVEQVQFDQLLIEQKRLLELIATGEPLGQCLSSLCEAIPGLSSGVRASVLLADDLREKFKRPIAPGMNSSFEEGLKGAPINDLAIGTCGTAVHNGESHMCKDIANDKKWSKEWREICIDNNILACHSTPIFDKGKNALGSFMLCLNEPRKLSKWEHRLTQLGTYIAGVALEYDRSRQTLLKHEAQIKADLKDAKLLQSISTQLIEEENAEALYEKILDAATTVMRSEYASLQILQLERNENRELRLLAHRGFTPKAAEFWNRVHPDSKSACAKAMNTGERVVVPDVKKCDFMEGTHDLTTFLQIGIKAVQSTPLIARNGQLLGMISTHWSKPHKPSEHDLRLLDILARQAADLIKQKQDKKVLRENEKWFRQLMEKLPAAAYTCDSEGKITYFNKQAAEVWGREPELNSSVERFCGSVQLYLPDETPINHNECWMALALKNEKEYHEKEIIIEREDGRRTSALTYITPIYDEFDKLIGAVNIAVDISDRKQVEQSLRQSKEKYRSLFESIDEGFCIIKMIFDSNNNPVDYRFVEVNSSFEQQAGMRDVTGKRMLEFVPHIEDHWLENYGNVALTGKPIRFTAEYKSLNRWFDVYAFKAEGWDRDKLAVLFKDITELKKGQEEQRRLLREVENEREHLMKIFKNAPSFMCIQRGPKHVYERANDLYRRLVGERKLVGKPVREALPELEGQGFFDLLDQVYETGKPYIGTDVKVVLQHPENEEETEERFLDFVYQPIRDSDGEINGIFTQGVDLTERKQAKRELQEMNESLEKKVEDRTSSLLAYQRQLRHLATRLSKTEEEERRRLATELHDNLGQLLAICKMKMDAMGKNVELSDIAEASGLVNDALNYTRKLMSELKPPPSLGEEDLVANIEWLTEKMKKYNLKVISNSGEHHDLIYLHEDVQITLVQSIRELLFNVVKHANVNEAYITLSYSDYHLEITVEDKGKGFDKNNIEENLTEDGGFGLFNIRERVDLLGGSIEIESTPGEGTKVNLIVPLEEEKPADQPERNESKGKRSGPIQNDSKIKVLLVDDHAMMRKGLKNIIDGENDLTVVAEASDGEEALKLAHEVQSDVIIMDVNLPGMSGIDATKKIKSELPKTVVIGLSVYDDKEVAQEMKNVGASAYLTKSDAFETLCSTIRSEVSSLIS